MNEQATVPCRFCGAATRMTETKECDRCWALKLEMERVPPLVLRRITKEIADANKREARQFEFKGPAPYKTPKPNEFGELK